MNAKSHATQNEQIANENALFEKVTLLKHLQKQTTQAMTLTNTGRESKTGDRQNRLITDSNINAENYVP